MEPKLVPSDADLLPIVEKVLKERVGNLPHLLGCVMIELGGRANPAQVKRLIEHVLAKTVEPFLTTMEFVKIEAVDDWASVGYYLSYDGMPPKGSTRSHRDFDQRYRIKDGDVLEVKWPNGQVTKEVFFVQEVPTSYMDHGHRYDTTTENMYIHFRDSARGVITPYNDWSKVTVRRT